MLRLPLFPLAVVLFPGAYMPLHIFEERYREMVADCNSGSREFGLIYHEPDEMGPFLSEPGRVGTIARIEKHQSLPDGRSMILIRGMSRFSIDRELPMEKLYYEADVLPFGDGRLPDPGAIIDARAHTLDQFMSVLDGMEDFEGPIPDYDLNLDLSFQLAPAVQIDGRWQQSLLEVRTEAERLERLDAVFQAAIEGSAE